MSAPDAAPPSEEGSLPQRFFRFFQQEITALQEQIERLADRPTVGGERADAAEHCLAAIARLSSEVKDASTYLPTYDQRTYAEAVKALQEKLQETRAAFVPKSKFSFKARKSPSAISLSDAAELASQKRKAVPGYLSPNSTTPNTSVSVTPAHLQTPPNERSAGNRPVPANPQPSTISQSADPAEGSSGGPERPSLTTTATSISISSQSNAHIILPASSLQPSTPCILSRLSSCVLDLISPTTNSKPFASLTINSTSSSLLLCGNIDGPAHITGVSDSVLLLSTRQFRMHHCSNVNVYLHCQSRPIIEDCSGIKFSPLPAIYSDLLRPPKGDENANMYDQVDDFKWLKSEPSPNWSIMKEEDKVPEDTWREVVPGGPGWSVEDILRGVGIKS